MRSYRDAQRNLKFELSKTERKRLDLARDICNDIAEMSATLDEDGMAAHAAISKLLEAVDAINEPEEEQPE